MKPRGDEAAYDLFELHGGTPSGIDDSLPVWARLHPDPEPILGPTRLLLDLMTDSHGIIHYREIDATGHTVNAGFIRPQQKDHGP